MKHDIIRAARTVLSQIAVTAVLFGGSLASAQQMFSVESSTDGNGLFSYTFNLGDPGYVMRIGPDNGIILIQSHGILDIYSPPGWTATVYANDFIGWTPTNGTAYLGQPSLTFSVLSSYTASTLYDQWGAEGLAYTRGVVGGTAVTLPDYQPVGEGIQNFALIGPQVVPEPSTVVILGFALLCLKGFRPRKGHCKE